MAPLRLADRGLNNLDSGRILDRGPRYLDNSRNLFHPRQGMCLTLIASGSDDCVSSR